MKALALADIRTDGGTQPRAVLDFDAIEVYAEAMKAGAKFPPLDVFYDGETYWLADGFHRHRAAFQSDIADFSCKIHQGTLQDAQWFSFSVNQSNGLYRSNADKQRAVKAALQHPKSKGMSDRSIAKHVGVDHQTVAAWREKTSRTGEIPQSPHRTGRDGRTINVANIGKSQKAELPEAAATMIRADAEPPRKELAPRSSKPQEADSLAILVLEFMTKARRLAELSEWLISDGQTGEARQLLGDGMIAIAPLIERIERRAVLADPLNAGRLRIGDI